MFDRLTSAYRYFICLRSSEFESRQFSVIEAILEIYFEFFA
ncbi:hypothetical protein [Chamaesiphon minutus]|uniref:Uncharacterized protein n=1 Tax=Chamaesiphon minutus (strain ATCC 27169 / PCC 6605) TaxID=1173020 RepID=K9UBR5_CHAP6|nr:hypothetical protein [Chamaesiphon minutus]AFY92552.1 hypothetical protein Cha6605_1373 [Chamaesiphon minutus PCC 6605]